MSDTYKTIAAPAEGYFTDRKSKFYSFAYPVTSEQEVKEKLKQLHKKYYDARHIVYAFVLGPEGKTFRASDAGEPAGSSGPPVLRTIQSMGLTDVMVAVVRYFGGKKLGIPGLINAYQSAARDALENATIVEKTITDKVQITCKYNQISQVMNLIQNFDGKTETQEFTDICKITALIPRSKTAQFISKLTQIQIQANKLTP